MNTKHCLILFLNIQSIPATFPWNSLWNVNNLILQILCWPVRPGWYFLRACSLSSVWINKSNQFSYRPWNIHQNENLHKTTESILTVSCPLCPYLGPRQTVHGPLFAYFSPKKKENRKKAPENFRFLTRRRHSSARSLSTANLMMLSMSIYGCDSHLYCSSLFKVTCAMVLINSRVSLPSKITWPQLTCTPLDGLRSTCLLLRHPHLAYTWTKKSSKNSLLFYHFIVAFSARRCKCKNNSTTSDVLVREKKITADKTMSEASTK